jgi:hypothetical protein
MATNAFDQLFGNDQPTTKTTTAVVTPSQPTPAVQPVAAPKPVVKKSVFKKPKETGIVPPFAPPEPAEIKLEKRRVLKGTTKTVRAKTFFLEDDFLDMFKFLKFKLKKDESILCNEILEMYFIQAFGTRWRELLD